MGKSDTSEGVAAEGVAVESVAVGGLTFHVEPLYSVENES